MAEVGSGARSKAILSLVGTLLVASTLVAVVAPARPAAARHGHLRHDPGARWPTTSGVNDGTGGSNCIRYSPTSAPTVKPLELRHQPG